MQMPMRRSDVPIRKPSRAKFGQFKMPPRKLTDAQVEEIRARSEAGETDMELAGEYNITAPYVWMITNGRGRGPRPAAD
jgi:hypothetical protein